FADELNHSPPRRGAWVGCRLAFKSFLPRFFTKKRAGSRGGALGRAPQRAELSLCSQSAGGGQRGNPRRGFPLCGRPRRPQPARFADARSHPTPGGGRRNVVRPAGTVTAGRRGRRPLRGGWETGRVPRDFPGAGHNAGNSENAARSGGVFIRFSRAARPPAKGEPPARVPPLTPSCAALAQGAF